MPNPLADFDAYRSHGNLFFRNLNSLKCISIESSYTPSKKQSLMLVSDGSKSVYTAQLKYVHKVYNEMTTSATKLDFVDSKFETETSLNCVASFDGLVVFEDEQAKLMLMNPTTRELKELPTWPYTTLGLWYYYTMAGIGYDSLIDDYKVVTLSYPNNIYIDELDFEETQYPDDAEMFVDVYSVKDGTWKRAESSSYNHAAGDVTSGVFVHGCMHWLANAPSGSSSVIVAFDIEEEEYYEVPPPSVIEHEKFVCYRLVALGSCLAMSCISLSCETDIWVMEEYGVKESWTKFTIFDSEESKFRPLCLLGKEQVVLVKDEEYDGVKLLMYDKEEGESKGIVIQGIPDGLIGFGGTFLESLVSPHCKLQQ